ncbi:MAG TPA: nucleotidyl transferase AbiEii/AbiGii toxin family protein [bacterium]|nr:nucleotidyl transferase AbiEii/AbiGii toxin family protein [bacterium]HOL47928.1 nucleotidyl transferase AbiEii/AbiGii toxin family protein [bacterium]HPQ19891.1 nucleotidyl transferase AbiEii/AbiGii toxin family protein [bacterium]
MDLSNKSILTDLQKLILENIFDYLDNIYLTGGTALSEYYFKHRYSIDLDFFTNSEETFKSVIEAISTIMQKQNLFYEIKRDSNFFKHINIIQNNKEQLILHFSKDTSFQIKKEKNIFGKVIVDTIEDIFINKICAILGRSEIKDLIDLYFFEKNSYKILDYFKYAQEKDGGLSEESFAYCLNNIEIYDFSNMMIMPLIKNDLIAFKENLIRIMLEISFNKK